MPSRPRGQRGHIEQLPSGSYRAVVYAGVDPLTGKERRLKESAKTLKAAEVALTKLQRQVDQELHPKTDITVGAAIAQWLRVAELEETTRERYEDLVRIYLAPTIGALPAARLDAELLEDLYARLQRCRSLCSGRPRSGHTCEPLASSTVRKIHFIVSGALQRAVRWHHLAVNKAALAAAPRPAKAAPDPPTSAEAAAVMNAAWVDPEWGLLLWLMMVTGLRRGEVSALRWRHVDWDRACLLVQYANAQPRTGIREKKTKTGQQRRVALDSQTMSLIAAHRDRAVARCATLGMKLRADAWIFSPAPDYSSPYSPRSLSHRYRRLAVKLNLSSTRLHSLRHYSATELIAAGVDLRTVAGRLGHGGGGSTTLRVYAAWVDEAGRRAAETIAGLVPKPVPLAPEPRGPYEVIASELRARIQGGELQSGALLPTVVELAQRYSVSVGTAHRAISLLADEGLIAVSRGRRAVVVALRSNTRPAGS
jgi:integrase